MSEIRQWLEARDLGDYADAFEAERIDLDALPHLTEAMVKEIGLPIGPRAKLMAAIAVGADEATELRKAPAAVTPAPLAAKILATRASIEGERKQVTVLFADVKGSTAIIQGLDPEDARALLDPLLTIMMDAVHKFEGTVNDVQGDGIMAIFGAPIAHEDHALRACRAAIAMQDMTRPDTDSDATDSDARLRVGLHSGEVVVRAINNDLTMSYSAVGVTTHLAARMEQLAEPGTIRMSADTHRLVRQMVEVSEGEKVEVKGMPAPVEVYELRGLGLARSRLEAASLEGLTPFVGRVSALETLDQRFAEARDGRGQVVTIVGDPGIGKSRMLMEFRQRIGPDVRWSEGRCISFGQSMAFHPFIDMLRRNFRIRDDDSSETIRAKVADHLAKLGSDLESKLPLIHYMLDVAEPDDPIHTMDRQIRRGETFDLLRSLVVLSADKRPQVVVLEDLHWADNGTQDFLTHILDSVPRIRVLALLTFRPEYAQPIGDRTYFTRLSLQNFSEAESAQMTNAVLASKNLPDALQALVRRKAEGNPFFVEEIIKSLRETEAILMGEDGWVLGRALDQIVVPDTVQDVVASRIDRLGEEPRRALQLASIIGREFTQRLLDRITDLQQSTDDCLRDLQAIELIYEKALYPELAYMFKHALTQDVAYGSLLARQRRELHQKVGEAIEELYADRLAEHSAVLGHHFARAEQWPKAANYFEQAADHAAAAFAVPEAIALCDQAIEARDRSGAKSAPRKIAKLYEKKAELLVAVSDFRGAFEAYEQEAKLGHELANPLLEGSALAGMGLAALFLHDFEASLALSVRTIKIGSDLESPELQAAGQWNQGFVQAVTARLDESRASFEAAHGLGEAANSPFHQGLAGSFLALLDSWAGNYRAAETASRAAGAVVREAELVWPMMFTQWSRGLVLTAMGAHDPAFESFESALAVAEKLGDEIYRNRCLNSMGWLHAECGDFDGSIAFNQKGVGVSRERGDPETIANSELNLGDAFLAKGDAVLASDMFAGVHGLVNKPATSDWMKWRYSQHLFAGLGETWLVLDDPAKAEDFCNQCLDLAAPTDSRKYLARGWRLKGEIAVARRQWDDARAALEKALEFAVRIGNPTQLWKTHAARGRYFRATGGLEAMAESLSAAEDVIDRIGAALATPALRDGFARSPVLHQVRDSVAAE